MKPLVIQNKKKLGYSPNKAIITPRDTKSVSQYFNEINQLDASILTKAEEHELFTKIAQGDEGARKKVLLANLRFVISVAKNYINQGLPFEDLVNEGNLGLIKAVNKFETDKNVKFISYAVWWIRQAILQALVETGSTVKVPINKNVSLLKVNKIIAELEQRLERKPTLDEIVEHAQEINLKNNNSKTAIDTDDITNILLSKMTSSSLDEPISGKNGDEDGSLHDILPAEGISYVSNTESIEKEIKVLLSKLTDQERNIIEMSYGVLREKRYTLEQISEIYSLSRERVRQIKEDAIRTLRNDPSISILLEYAANR